MTDSCFRRVLLADQLSDALLGQTAIEGLEVRASYPDRMKWARRSRLKQDALILLTLFDEVMIAETGGVGYSLPLLEENGILRNIPERRLGIERDFMRTGWFGSRDSRAFSRMLRRTRRFRPLVLNYLLRRDLPIVGAISTAVRSTRRSVIDAMLDFALDYYEDRDDRLHNNLLVRRLPKKLIADFKRYLRFQQPRDGLNGFDVVLFGAGIGASRLEHYQLISSKLGAGIATRDFLGPTTGWTIEGPISPVAATKTFAILRTALHEQVSFFPRIESVEHALRLRKDPALSAFRDRIRELQVLIARGKIVDIALVQREVAGAARALKRTSKLHQSLNWTTYLSVPIVVAEAVLHGVPIVSGSVTALSVVATYYQERLTSKSQWVLFGR